MMSTKECTKCLIFKPFSEFCRARRESDGLQDRCRSCNRAYRTENKDQISEYKRKHYLDNREAILAYTAAHIKANKNRYSVYKANHRAAKLKASPPWLSEEQRKQMKTIYENRPKGYHVDHEVPLQGKNVCGLHVPWNLQYLSARDNISKKNKF